MEKAGAVWGSTVHSGENRAILEPHYLPAFKSWLRVYFLKGKPVLVFPHHSKELRKSLNFRNLNL